jgi:hypothetical protein
MGLDRSEAGNGIEFMVFTPTPIVNLFRLCARCKPLAALKGCSSPDRGVWSLPSSQPEMDASRQSPPCLRTFPVIGISQQYAVISKQWKPWKLIYWRLLTAYCLLVLYGSKETTPPSPGSKRERAEHPPGVHASVRDNFVYEIYYFYNFVTRCLRRPCLSPSQPPVLVGKQVSNRHGTLLAMGKRE